MLSVLVLYINVKGSCYDHFFPTVDFPIKTVILISEDSPYFSHHPCKILGPKDFSFRRYKRKSSELRRKVVTTNSICVQLYGQIVCELSLLK